MSRIIVVATLEFSPENRVDWLGHAERLVEATVSGEPGVLTYFVTPDARTDTRVLVTEVYEDRASLDAHVASAHFRKFRADVVGCAPDSRSLHWYEASDIESMI